MKKKPIDVLDDLFLKFHHFRYFPIPFQIFSLVSLYCLSIFLGYSEFQEKGTIMGIEKIHNFLFFVPIYEEIIFRSLLFGILLWYFSFWKALLVSSFFFGIWHVRNVIVLPVDYVIHQTLYTMLFFGPVAAFLTYKTKSVWFAVQFHYVNNIFAAYLTPILFSWFV